MKERLKVISSNKLQIAFLVDPGDREMLVYAY